MKKQIVLVLVGLSLGALGTVFATGRVRAQGLPPPVAVATRWEQDCEQTRGVDEARTVAKARGEAGWELVALDAGVLCFKRPFRSPVRSPDPWPGY